MVFSGQTQRQRWIDDCLDLYNYAGRIGDAEWQLSIMQKLKDRDPQLRRVRQKELRERYQAISRKMAELVRQLNESADGKEIVFLRELLWELKLQRMSIAKQMQSYEHTVPETV